MTAVNDYRKLHSTETALLKIMDDLNVEVETGTPPDLTEDGRKGLPSPFNEGRLPVALLPVYSPKLRGWHTPCKTNS